MSKKLGQHFLKNPLKLRKIADSLDLREGDFVVEIGPGNGELTREIARHPIRLVAIEKDERLYEKLVKSNWKSEKTEFVNGDILKILPDLPQAHKLLPGSYKIVGNIPYYITGKLLRTIGELDKKPKLVVLTTQKEVAERICAAPPKMNLLAASVQFWADVQIIDHIPRKDFKPQPKVDSAIVKLEIKKNDPDAAEEYYRLTKILFKQPRKTILNNLSHGFETERDEIKERLKELKINSLGRPQDLGITEIIELSRELKLKTEGARNSRIH